MTVAQLRVSVRAARPAPSAPPPVDERSESFGGWFDDDGRYHLDGELDADHGREFEAALREARDALFQSGPIQGDVGGRVGGNGPPIDGRRLVGVVGTGSASNWFVDPADPVPARLAGRARGPPLAPSRCSPVIDPVSPVFTANARPVSVGRTQHAVPERTRRLVLYRDQKCRVPWCNQTRWLQVHHIIHDEHGGPTDTWQPMAAPLPGRATGSTTRVCWGSPATPTTSTGSPSPTLTAGSSTPPPTPPSPPAHHHHRGDRTSTLGGTPPTLGPPLPRPTDDATSRA